MTKYVRESKPPALTTRRTHPEEGGREDVGDGGGAPSTRSSDHRRGTESALTRRLRWVKEVPAALKENAGQSRGAYRDPASQLATPPPVPSTSFYSVADASHEGGAGQRSRNFLVFGRCGRHPKLKLVAAEAGAPDMPPRRRAAHGKSDRREGGLAPGPRRTADADPEIAAKAGRT